MLLKAVPKEHIDYAAIDAKADGSFAIQVFVKGLQAGRTVVADIIDGKGKTVASINAKVNKGDSFVVVNTKVNNALQWTSETPNLYKVNVYLKDATKNLYQTLDRFGFRTIEVALDPFKKEVYKWTWKIKTNEQLLSGVLYINDSTTTAAETDTTFTLQGGDVSVILNKKTGMLAGTKNVTNDNLSFTKGPVLVQGNATLSGSRLYKEGNSNVVEFTYDGAMKYARWKMFGSGWVSLEYEYALNGSYPFAGVSFSYPENFILGAKWLGKGPYRQWKNRLQGTPVNVWQNLYNNTHTGYPPVLYPEFKGYYGEITWMVFNTVEGRFSVASKDTGLYVRLFDFYALSGATRPHPELPVGNISFFDAIPPIGTKLALNISYNTSQLGPQILALSENNLIKLCVKNNQPALKQLSINNFLLIYHRKL